MRSLVLFLAGVWEGPAVSLEIRHSVNLVDSETHPEGTPVL